MNIIIIGSGAVGAAICSQLAEERHAITVVDRDMEALTEITNSLDITGIHGNGADVEILKQAGAEDADLLIAVTNEDELNILCCFAARKLGTTNTIARVRNPEYSGFMSLMQEDLNLSLTINPEYAVAKEIYRIIRFPGATRLSSLCQGKVELAEVTIRENSALIGKSLLRLRMELDIKFIVCAVMRDDKVYIPSGNFVLEEGDTVAVTADEAEITKFFKASGKYIRPIKELIVYGGGRTTYYLGELLKKRKINLIAIEKDKELCRALAEEFPEFTVIHGDGTNQELLIEEGIKDADAFLALSSVDEENAIVSMFAKTQNVPKVVTMISSLPYIDFFRGVGIESIVSPKSSTVGYILRFIRSQAASAGSEIEALYRIMEGKIEALEFKITEEMDGITDVPLRELKRREGCIICCIVRDGDIIFPTGDDFITVDDTVIVISRSGQISSFKDIKA